MIKRGICSVSFREKSVDEIIMLSKKGNLQCIEWGEDVHVPSGNIEYAKTVKRKTEEVGLTCPTYGSYYRMDEIEKFDRVSLTAEALGASIIRIWGSNKDAALMTEKDEAILCEKLFACAEIAQKREQTIALEYHHGTCTANAQTAKRILQSVNLQNVKTYWQPMYWLSSELSEEERIRHNLQSIELLKEYVVCVHTYQWQQYNRLALTEGEQEWKRYMEKLGDTIYHLEFIKDDSEEQFFEDCQTLQNWSNRIFTKGH